MRTSSLVLFLVLSGSLIAAGQRDHPSPADPGSETRANSSPAPDLPPDLKPDANGALSLEQMRDLIRVVTENYRANYKKERDYTYIDREVENKLDAKGDIKSTSSRTYEVVELYGEQVQRLIAKGDMPLSAQDAAREEERIDKLTSKRKNESNEDRAKRLREEETRREKNREFIREVADAYDFRLVGSEVLNGRDAWVIAGEPRPDFRAHVKEAQMLSKFHGQLWIDKSDLQLAKMDVEALDTASFGWVLARIHKGTRLIFEQTRVNGEVWLPHHVSLKLDARIALFKGFNEQSEETYRDYKKFRSSTRILGYEEVRQR